jgi:ubiquinone/menaquinone biosynthesis C-methylase UbiE
MDPDEAAKQTAKIWSTGDYAGLSERLRPAAQALADACAVGAGQEVLDVAAGDGNFAMACAAEGCAVVASDLAPGMVEKGRARTEAEGYDVEWVEANAQELPFDDDRFECVGSVFGAMIAPEPELVARELFRVVRPGNTVGMTAWTPDGRAVEMFDVGRRYAPGGPPAHTPDRWGVEDNVRRWFDGLANSIEFERRSVIWEADSPEDFVAMMERSGPPQAAAKASMPPDVYAQMRADMVEVARGWAGGDGPFAVDAEYLQFVARRRG